MPVSRDVSDYNLSAIEATIRETAPGRAFLANYARRIRRSDTMTLLAMFNRLEQLCRDQAVRVAELDGSGAFIAKDNALVAGRQDGTNDRNIQNVLERSDTRRSSNFPKEFGVTNSTDPHVEQEDPSAFSNREAMRRLEELAATISELDRRTTDLVARLDQGIGSSIAAIDHPVQDDQEKRQTIASAERSPLDKKVPAQEANILDEIAKALSGTV